jgi:hypothetical protein
MKALHKHENHVKKQGEIKKNAYLRENAKGGGG